jgi:hypothetical protein
LHTPREGNTNPTGNPISLTLFGTTKDRASLVAGCHARPPQLALSAQSLPLLMVPVVPRIHRRMFEDKFRQRTGGARAVYDLRRSFAFILEAAGIVRTRQRAYMGHGAGDTTALYELYDVAAYLADDARKLRGVQRDSGKRPAAQA